MTLLLILIYVAFVSLGLPDSMLGSAWPAIQADLNAPLALCGYIGMVCFSGTIVSSLLSNRLISRFGVGRVTAVSVTMTAAALFGYSTAPSGGTLFVWAIVLGLGGGSVDAALNNFIALHYGARHMNWIHCFWSGGATVGPMILSALLAKGLGWRGGYGAVSAVQFVLAAVLFAALPLWKRADADCGGETVEKAFISNRDALRLPGVWLALLGCLFFCSVETTCGMWAATYLNRVRGFSAAQAAVGASTFYGAITFGSLVVGFAAARFTPVQLIRWGQILCLTGAAMLMLPLPPAFGMAGMAVLGIGTSPVFPNMLHETPGRFGAKNSQAVVGLQMAFAYAGCMAAPPLFGTLASATTLQLYPYFLMLCTLVMMVCCEALARRR